MPDLLPAALAFFLVTVSPGPANIAVASVSMAAGRTCGMRFGAGLAAGLAFWGLVAATGLGALLQSAAEVLAVLKLLGGLYLLWLAWQSARAALAPAPNAETPLRGGRWFWRGLILNLSNPKAVVAWLAALSMGLGAGDSLAQLAAVTLLCMVLGLLNYAGHALAFSAPAMRAGYRRLRRWVEGAVAGLFALAGLGLIRAALART